MDENNNSRSSKRLKKVKKTFLIEFDVFSGNRAQVLAHCCKYQAFLPIHTVHILELQRHMDIHDPKLQFDNK